MVDKIQHTTGVAKESQSSGIVQIFTIQENFWNIILIYVLAQEGKVSFVFPDNFFFCWMFFQYLSFLTCSIL